VFDVISGIIVGKSVDEYLWSEYKALLKKIVPSRVSIVANINIGHALPRCIIPFGRFASVDVDAQKIVFD
jgi:muramoyltetrapeptide carboxypeptidase LdcA involved in peptidoglycan recycling